MDTTATLNQAIAAAKAGRKTEARRLLETVLDIDERNEQAWLWLSGVVEDEEERLICLENVLTINPDNEAARKGLAVLRPAPVTDQPSSSYTAEGLHEGSPVTERLQRSTSWPASRTEAPVGDVPSVHPSVADRRVYIAIALALVLILVCTVVSTLAFVILSPAG